MSWNNTLESPALLLPTEVQLVGCLAPNTDDREAGQSVMASTRQGHSPGWRDVGTRRRPHLMMRHRLRDALRPNADAEEVGDPEGRSSGDACGSGGIEIDELRFVHLTSAITTPPGGGDPIAAVGPAQRALRGMVALMP